MANRGIVTWVEFVGTPYVAPPEGFLSPSGDVSDGSWTTQAGGTALAAVLDETVRDDSDYVQSNSAVLNDVFEVHLSDPGSTFTNGVLQIAIGKKTNNADVVDFAVELRQGTTVIASWVYADVPYGTVTKSESLTPAQFAAITDFTDLRVRVTAGRFWTPAQLISGGKLARWYSVPDAAVVDGSGNVQTLTDLSGNGVDATQATAGSRPAYEAASPHNGKPGIICSTGLAKSLSMTAVSYNGTNGLSWSFVASQTAVGTGTSNCLVGGGTGGLEVRLNYTSPGWDVIRQAQLRLILMTAPAVNTLSVLGCDLATNSTIGWVDGTSSSNSTNPGLSNGGDALLSAGGTEFLNGRFQEAVASTLKWTTAERQKVDGYLAWKYRTTLDASHPYKNRPPFVGD